MLAQIASVLAVVAPVFLILGAGFLASKAGKIQDAAVDALLGFVIRFAVPTLLFGKLYQLDLQRYFDPQMLIAFYTGAAVSFALGAALARAFGRRPGEQVAIGFCAYFSNTVLMGLPILERAYGREALEPMLAIIVLHAPMLYMFGMAAMEFSRRDGQGAWEGARRAWRNISTNALTIGVALGITFNLAGITLPDPAAFAVDMFGSAALPLALFGIGAALTRYRLKDDVALAGGVAAVSLIIHPLIAWVLAAQVFALDEPFVRAAVVTAAMPAGMNGYIFASMYHRAEGVAASTVLLSTAASVLTVSVWLTILGGAGG